MKYRIGSRGSKLAMIQTESVRKALGAAYPEDEFEIVIIATKGDRVTDRPLAAIGDNSLFTREIENALIAGEIDLAVHSMKDLASECPSGLTLAKSWKREDPRDALVLKAGTELAHGARVATGSARRNRLLAMKRPDIRIVDIRGNVDTRLRKLREGGGAESLDGIILAVAGLKRLGLEDVITRPFEIDEMLPAANQGQLAIELRAADVELKAKLDALGDDDAEACAAAERGFLRMIGADCHVPVGAYAEISEVGIRLRTYFSPTADGQGVFCDVMAADAYEAAREAARRTYRALSGEVVLVGAGPGDPDLITVKGLEELRQADAVVYDRLASDRLLEYVKPGCRLHYAGKASGNHTLPQEGINALLARCSLECAKTVRLKGGDPFVFGRGGEEMEYLVERGIRCRTVPGVTSAIAAAESCMIPVTHRGVANSFEVVTAHAKGDSPLDLDFSKMTDQHKTHVFMMGLARIAEIAKGLISAGRDAETPCAVISSATTAEQKCVTGTLADIGERSSGMASPAVLIVGGVVALKDRLAPPFANRRFLVPVIDGGSRTLGGRLRGLGAEVDEPVVGRIAAIDGAVGERDLDGVDRIVITSRNGYLGLTEEVKGWVDARGIRVERVHRVVPEGNTLHFTQPDADRVDGVRAIDVYRNDETEIRGVFDLAKYDGAFFTCASSVRRVMAHSTGSTRMFAIGEKTAAALRKGNFRSITVSPVTTIDALIASALNNNNTWGMK